MLHVGVEIAIHICRKYKKLSVERPEGKFLNVRGLFYRACFLKNTFAYLRLSGKLPCVMSQKVFFQFKDPAFEFFRSDFEKKIADCYTCNKTDNYERNREWSRNKSQHTAVSKWVSRVKVSPGKRSRSKEKTPIGAFVE